MARLSFLALLAALGAGAIGCSTQVPLGQQGSPCDYDQQCDPAQGLSCECVRRRTPDEEGPDEIIAHGFCGPKGVQCPRDGGVDTGAVDTGASDTGASDTGASDTGASDTGANDTGASDTGAGEAGSDAASDAADAASSG